MSYQQPPVPSAQQSQQQQQHHQMSYVQQPPRGDAHQARPSRPPQQRSQPSSDAQPPRQSLFSPRPPDEPTPVVPQFQPAPAAAMMQQEHHHHQSQRSSPRVQSQPHALQPQRPPAPPPRQQQQQQKLVEAAPQRPPASVSNKEQKQDEEEDEETTDRSEDDESSTHRSEKERPQRRRRDKRKRPSLWCSISKEKLLPFAQTMRADQIVFHFGGAEAEETMLDAIRRQLSSRPLTSPSSSLTSAAAVAATRTNYTTDELVSFVSSNWKRQADALALPLREQYTFFRRQLDHMTNGLSLALFGDLSNSDAVEPLPTPASLPQLVVNGKNAADTVGESSQLKKVVAKKRKPTVSNDINNVIIYRDAYNQNRYFYRNVESFVKHVKRNKIEKYILIRIRRDDLKNLYTTLRLIDQKYDRRVISYEKGESLADLFKEIEEKIQVAVFQEKPSVQLVDVEDGDDGQQPPPVKKLKTVVKTPSQPPPPSASVKNAVQPNEEITTDFEEDRDDDGENSASDTDSKSASDSDSDSDNDAKSPQGGQVVHHDNNRGPPSQYAVSSPTVYLPPPPPQQQNDDVEYVPGYTTSPPPPMQQRYVPTQIVKHDAPLSPLFPDSHSTSGKKRKR